MTADDRRHPGDQQLAQYADGGLTAAARAEVERHLLQCPVCREVMAEAAGLLSDDPVPQRDGGRILRFRSRRTLTGVVAVLSAAAAAMVVVLLGPPMPWWDRPPFEALDDAYSRQRSIELRLPHARYGALSVNRGPSLADQPPPVLEALAQIRRQLDKPNADAQWHHANGVAALLMWRHDDAIRSLQRAADMGRATPDLWIDLASAYFERAEANGTAHDYTTSVELLSKALAADPGNAAALFNRAVVFSKLNLFDSAIADFNSAEKVERDPGWTEELRSRLKEAQEMRARMLGQSAATIPDAFVAESQFEDVLRNPSRMHDGGRGAGAEVRTLAARLAADHRDQWLSRVVDYTMSAGDVASLPVLGAMAKVRERVQVGEYARMSAAIERLAAARLGEPLAVWRDFELLYKASHSGKLSECPDATAMRDRASRLGYFWFEAQIALEQSTCDVGAKRLDAAQQATMRAIVVTSESRFRTASLRARGFLSSHLVNEARYQESFRVDRECLAEIVRDGYPVMRAHQFLNDLMRGAEGLERWNVARAAAQMAGLAARAAGYDLLEALALSKEGSFAESLGLHEAAARAYDLAAAKFDALHPSDDVRAYRAFVEISALANRGDYDGLLKRRSEIPSRGNVFFEIPLLTSLAALALERRDPAAAEAYAAQAIEFGTPATGAPLLIRREFSDVLERADMVHVRARLERGDPRAALTAWREHLLRAATSVGPAPPGPPADRAPPPGATLLTIANLQGRVGIWAETAGGMTFRWGSPSFDQLAVRLRELRFLAQSGGEQAASSVSLARDIERDMLGTLVDSGAETVYLQAKGELAWLQLALALGGEPSRTIILNPFGLEASRDEADGTGVALLAVAAAARARDVSLAALPQADREVRNLGRLMADARVETGPEVTASSVDHAMNTYRLVHFAGHAVRSADGTALVVTPDPADSRADARQGLWHLTPRVKIRARTVVLSACSTGATERIDSAAPNGLAEAMILAGAHRVVATLWDVDSSTTERFNMVFYGSLVQRGSVIEAFRAAREALRNEGAAGAGSWAAFALYARTDEE